MFSHISRQYDLLGLPALLFLKARLISQQLAIDELSWDESVDDRDDRVWNEWLKLLITSKDFSIPRWYFANEQIIDSQENFSYELQAFSDSSNEKYGCLVYLHRITNSVSRTSFVFGKIRIVLRSQQAWAIARKELTAAVMSGELINNT